MDWFTFLVCAVVAVAVIGFVFEKSKPIRTYNKAKRDNSLMTLDGFVCETLNQEQRYVKGKITTMSNPKVCVVVNDKKIYYISPARYGNVSIGEKVKVMYCISTNEAWVEKDLDFIKRELMTKSLLGIFVIFILCLIHI